MARTIDITYQGKELALPIVAWDMVAWEDYARENRLAIKPTDNAFQPSKYTCYLAYAACVRLNYCAKETTFHNWLAEMDFTETETEPPLDDDRDPTYGPVAQSIG